MLSRSAIYAAKHALEDKAYALAFICESVDDMQLMRQAIGRMIGQCAVGQYVLKTDFDQHRTVHRNDTDITFPRTLEELKQRFEMLGLYDEK